MADGYYTNGNQAGEAIVSMLADIGIKEMCIRDRSLCCSHPGVLVSAGKDEIGSGRGDL